VSSSPEEPCDSSLLDTKPTWPFELAASGEVRVLINAVGSTDRSLFGPSEDSPLIAGRSLNEEGELALCGVSSIDLDLGVDPEFLDRDGLLLEPLAFPGV